MKSTILIPALLLGATLSGAALADDRDAANSARAERALAERIALSDDTVTISTADGHMVLTGVVDSRNEAATAMLGAADVSRNSGVKVIENQLDVRDETYVSQPRP